MTATEEAFSLALVKLKASSVAVIVVGDFNAKLDLQGTVDQGHLHISLLWVTNQTLTTQSTSATPLKSVAALSS
jgi:hypothetical protein